MASGYGNVVQRWQVYGEAYIVSQTDTTATVRCDTYFHSIAWGYDVAGIGTATVNGQSVSSARVTCYAPSGATVNQHLITKDVVVNKRSSAFNVTCTAKVDIVGGYHNGTSTVNLTVSIPAKPAPQIQYYSVSYNTVGGQGAPDSQTKQQNVNITLSSVKPTKSCHRFQGWSTSPNGSVSYQPGATYSANASVVLYAVWVPIYDFKMNVSSTAKGVYVDIPSGLSIKNILFQV